MSLQIHVSRNALWRYFVLSLIFLQMYVVFIEPYYHGTRFEELRQLLGPRLLYGSVYFLVIVHGLEAFLALRMCLAKKLSLASTLSWVFSACIFGGPTLVTLRSSGANSKEHAQ
ncbi:hypothetical protein SPOG_05530 [Schizosaccharomyces cryophilus OY26]|uniref:Uncharacterized protein n=1 Tax=Schizosaccharomyces cryophilus (strain OY26 / ATCC MYA-4695 / CBS 11777 / NBRC 106824 / NRRL Y48691) TaxID=653667 RepID=S9W6D3_SCHCR|nr:uncharacterized protein SPOG_05530 [Schizosaccharomyces cryophilus OY26]EPY53380.1 hypothetical protein SPOG_05530 [Schizosaccharomyces cryophilus OY26]